MALDSKIKAVLWDLDDTLYSRVEAARLTFRKMLRDLFYKDRSDEFYVEAADLMISKRARNAMINDEVFASLLDAFPTDKPFDKSAAVDYYFNHIAENAVPFPEPISVIKALRERGIKNAIVTNISEQRLCSQRAKINALGIAPLFDAIVYSGEIGVHKPDPRIFEYAASLLGVMPSECLFVGDDPTSDVAGALAAGMEVVWVDRYEDEDGLAAQSGVHRVSCVRDYFD